MAKGSLKPTHPRTCCPEPEPMVRRLIKVPTWQGKVRHSQYIYIYTYIYICILFLCIYNIHLCIYLFIHFIYLLIYLYVYVSESSAGQRRRDTNLWHNVHDVHDVHLSFSATMQVFPSKTDSNTSPISEVWLRTVDWKKRSKDSWAPSGSRCQWFPLDAGAM